MNLYLSSPFNLHIVWLCMETVGRNSKVHYTHIGVYILATTEAELCCNNNTTFKWFCRIFVSIGRDFFFFFIKAEDGDNIRHLEAIILSQIKSKLRKWNAQYAIWGSYCKSFWFGTASLLARWTQIAHVIAIIYTCPYVHTWKRMGFPRDEILNVRMMHRDAEAI